MSNPVQSIPPKHSIIFVSLRMSSEWVLECGWRRVSDIVALVVLLSRTRGFQEFALVSVSCYSFNICLHCFQELENVKTNPFTIMFPPHIRLKGSKVINYLFYLNALSEVSYPTTLLNTVTDNSTWEKHLKLGMPYSLQRPSSPSFWSSSALSSL